MARAFIFLLVTIVYSGVWLALAMLFSIIFRSAATAALVTLGLWLFLTLIWPALAPAVVAAFAPTNNEETLILASQYLSRLSPSTMYGEVVLAILNPSTRALGPIYLEPVAGRRDGCAAAAWREPDPCLAADRRAGSRVDPAVRGRLYRLPAAGSAR